MTGNPERTVSGKVFLKNGSREPIIRCPFPWVAQVAREVELNERNSEREGATCYVPRDKYGLSHNNLNTHYTYHLREMCDILHVGNDKV